ncbi:MAG TPA: CocE/NonD family hydrolase [Thermoleophilaceae bacterium]
MDSTTSTAARTPLDRRLFGLAVGLIGLHVADDNFLQPEAGTSASDHLLSGLLPLALLALAYWAYPRLSGARRGALALFIGPLGIVTGIEAVHYANQVGPSGDDFTGFLAIPAGLLLLGLGAVTLWRTRRTDGNYAWRYTRRALLGATGAVVVSLFLMPISVAYIVTHTARAVVPESELGAAYEDVSFETGDGLELKGWYVPSRNGAAVISFPGRKGPQKPARMLARHGYGVLVFDRRGEGESEGEPNIFGWGGDRDIKAAIRFLQQRPDVEDDSIGGIGLSVGGELMLETAAETDDLKAVVSEGAGARAFSDEMDEEMSGIDTLLNGAGNAVKTGALTVFTNQAPAANLKDLVGKIAPRPLMLIAAPNSPNGEKLNRGYYAAAHEPKTLWEIPESGHMGGMEARPVEYERRVVGFFDDALL